MKDADLLTFIFLAILISSIHHFLSLFWTLNKSAYPNGQYTVTGTYLGMLIGLPWVFQPNLKNTHTESGWLRKRKGSPLLAQSACCPRPLLREELRRSGKNESQLRRAEPKPERSASAFTAPPSLLAPRHEESPTSLPEKGEGRCAEAS